MTDYISREAAINFIDAGRLVNPNEPRWSDNEVVAFMKKIPAADVVPVVHGKWGNRQICSNMCGYEYAMMCSVCNKPTYRISMMEDMPPYCQFCGARMDGGKTDA